MGSLEEEKKVKDLGSQFPSFFLVNDYEELNEGSCAACREHSCKEEFPELSSVKTCHHSPGFGPQISQMKPKEHSMRAEDQEASQSQDTELTSSPALLQGQGVVCTDGWAGSTSDPKCDTGTQTSENFTSLKEGLTSFLCPPEWNNMSTTLVSSDP